MKTLALAFIEMMSLSLTEQCYSDQKNVQCKMKITKED
jgi:hypothetical protein